MHELGGGATKAMKRFKVMVWVFSIAFVQKILSLYIPGLIYDWHIFTWFFIWGKYQNHAIDIENWGWVLELSPQSFGIGMLLDINVCTSVFAGSLLAYAILGPILVHTGECILDQAEPTAGPDWARYMDSQGAGTYLHDGQYVPSPYMWVIWPAIVALICSGFIELALNIPSLFAGVNRGFKSLYNRGRNRSLHEQQKEQKHGSNTDQAVSAWIWGTGLLVSTIAVCVSVQFQWDVNGAYILMALVISMIMAFVA
jgi:uncharacterized oligopeptide transporter (OPT) family protein